MFYHLEILRKRSPFYPLWVADTYPRRFLRIPENKIWSYNLSDLCDNLTEIIKTDSMNPSKRFSLRLSAQLIYGVLKLYERQSNLLLHSVFTLNMSITKRRTVEEEKPKRKSKKSTSEERPTIQETIQQLPEQLIPQDDVVRMLMSSQQLQNTEITLRENMLVQMENKADNFGEEGDPMVIFQQENLLRDLNLGDSALEQSHLLTCVAQVHRQHDDLPDKPLPLQDISQLEKTAAPTTDTSMMETMKNMELAVVVDETIQSINESTHLPDIQVTRGSQEPQHSIEVMPPPATRAEKRNHTSVNLDETPELDPNVSMPLPKKRRHVVRDAHIFMSHDYMKARIQNVHLEKRCRTPLMDAVNLEAAVSDYRLLLSYRGFSGRKIPFQTNRLAAQLRKAFSRNLNTKTVPNDKAGFKKFKPIEDVRAADMNETYRNLTANPITIEEHHLTLPPNVDDLHLMIPSPTRKSLSLTTHDRSVFPDLTVPDVDITKSDVTTEKNISNKKSKPVSILHTTIEDIRQDLSKTVSFDVSEKRKRTEPKKGPARKDKSLEIIEQTTSGPCKGILKDILPLNAGVDAAEKLMDVTAATDTSLDVLAADAHNDKENRSPNETLLGSLDRTQVSLGDDTLSKEEHETREYLEREWGNVGVWEKIVSAKRARCYPLNVECLVQRATVPNNISKRRVAVNIFKIILFMKKHRFIKVQKHPEDLTIVNIRMGEGLKELNKK